MVFWFTAMPFGFNITPRVFTMLSKTVASSLASWGLHVLMYLVDWLNPATSTSLSLQATSWTIAHYHSMGFAFILSKSMLLPSQHVTWLRLERDSTACSVQLSEANRWKLVGKLRQVLWSVTFTRPLWSSLIGSLIFAAFVIPLGRLWCLCVAWEGYRSVPLSLGDRRVLVPAHLQPLLRQWLV